MSMYCTPPETRKARKLHRCTSCGEAIEPGNMYLRWCSYEDGDSYVNKMHHECRAAHDADSGGHQWDYMPYSYQRPERAIA